MLRISHYLRALARPTTPVLGARSTAGARPPVVIWNLLRRCNLTCKHCYATSADSEFRDELETAEAFKVIDDLHAAGVRVLILSGGEPLLRKDIFELSDYARDKVFFVALSTNGTLIDERNIEQIVAARYDYVGISIDGLEAVHDDWRQLKGSFAASMHAIDLCRQHDIRVGLRTTLTQNNYPQLPAILELMREHDVQKFYLSHLNYSGRGKRSRKADAHHQMTREPCASCSSRPGTMCRTAARPTSSAATTTPTPSCCCSGSQPTCRSTPRVSRACCAPGAATLPAAASPTSTTSATCTRTPTGGSTRFGQRTQAELPRDLAGQPATAAAAAAPASARRRRPLRRLPLAVDLQRQHPHPRLGRGQPVGRSPGRYLTDEEIGLPTPQRIPSIAI
ncbi:PqqA peptide cyclase [Stutzerimonas stutzeri]